MTNGAGDKTTSARRWPPQPGTVDSALLALTAQVIATGRARLPREQRLKELKQLKVEIAALQARQDARSKARTAILKAAEALLSAYAADPEDADLGILHVSPLRGA